MAADATTLRMISRYQEEAPAPLFLAGHFQSPPRNYHLQGKVKVDVQRDGRDVAIVVKNINLGPNKNQSTAYSSKEFTPPLLDEEGDINSWETFDRLAGQDPFQDVEFVDKAMEDAFRLFRKLDAKIRRTTELMCSQIFQGAKLELASNDGTQYELDFQGKASHFPTVSTPWGTMGADPYRDLGTLANEIRKNGKRSPYRLVAGPEALDLMLRDPTIKERLDNRGMSVGQIRAPEPRGVGANFHGWLNIDGYIFELFSYAESYDDPVSGQDTLYVPNNKVVMLSRDARLDLTHGGVPLFRRPDNLAARFLPSRIADPETGLDMTTNAYISPDGKRLVVGAAARPLPVPTAIDTFGCLTVYPDGDS